MYISTNFYIVFLTIHINKIITSNNTLSWLFVLGLLFYLITSLIYLHKKLNNFLKLIKIEKNTFEIKQFTNNSILMRYWENYKNTFERLQNNKTQIHAEAIFEENAILSQLINLRYWMDLPNIFIGIGIFGTFLGLTVGISGFNMENSETIQESIKALLAGMSTAFWSSLAGVGLSILLKFIKKHKLNIFCKQIRILNQYLDDNFLISKQEQAEQELQEREKYISKITQDFQDQIVKLETNIRQLQLQMWGIKDKEGRIIQPAIILSHIHRNGQEQAKALKSFSSDLADGIKISSSTIQTFSDAIESSMQGALDTKLSPIMQTIDTTLGTLKTEIKKLSEVKEESSAALLSQVVDNMKTAMAKMLGQFQNNMNSLAKNDMEKLSINLQSASESLKHLPSKLEKVMSATEHLLKQQNETIGQTVNSVHTASNTAVTTMSKQVQDAAAQLGTSRSELEKILSSYKNVFKDNQELSKQIQSSESSIFQAQQKSHNSLQQVVSSFEKLRELEQDLYENQSGFYQKNKALIEEQQNALKHLEQTMTQNAENSKQYVNDFTHIKNGLQEIFHKLETGLNEYGNVTREQLNKYLQDFSTHLSTASTALANSVDSLQGPLDDLVDRLDKNSSKRGPNA